MLTIEDKNGFLPVGDGHTLYFETYGNPEGIPVVFLHGGPGMGCAESDRRFFVPENYYVILFDQRGCKRSTPYGSLENIEPFDHARDISLLLDHIGIGKAWLFGGSWGSSLAMIYAIQNPERTLGLVLRGFFPANKECVDFFVQGGCKPFYPKAWKRFSAMVPKDHQHEIASYYLQKILSENKEESNKYAFEWGYFGYSVAFKVADMNEVDKEMKSGAYQIESKMESFYSAHNCFLPKDYIFENVDKVRDMPVYIVQGRFDMLCPPEYAIRLHESLQGSQLYLVDAGHVSSEPAIEQKLMEVMAQIVH